MSANTATNENLIEGETPIEATANSAEATTPQSEGITSNKPNISIKIINFLELIGFTWFIPIVRLLAGEDPVVQLKEILKVVGVPVLAMLIFLGLWSWGASKVHTSLGAIPGPAAVWEETKSLAADHYKEKEKEIGSGSSSSGAVFCQACKSAL